MMDDNNPDQRKDQPKEEWVFYDPRESTPSKEEPVNVSHKRFKVKKEYVLVIACFVILALAIKALFVTENFIEIDESGQTQIVKPVSLDIQSSESTEQLASADLINAETDLETELSDILEETDSESVINEVAEIDIPIQMQEETLSDILNGLKVEAEIDIFPDPEWPLNKIPLKHTCFRGDVPPELSIEGLPEDTMSYAIIMMSHYEEILWIQVHGLENDKTIEGTLHSGTPYQGPCDPVGEFHYRLYILAFDERVDTNETEGLESLQAKILALIPSHFKSHGIYPFTHYFRL